MNSASSVNFDSILKKLEECSAFHKECIVGGLKVSMRVLSFSEELKLSRIVDEISANEDYSALGDWKKYVVALSIFTLDGQVIPDILEVSNGESGVEKIEKSLYLKEKLDNLPTKITETLFDVYSDLKEESEKSLENDIKYNWFKDPATRKKEEEERIKEENDARNKELKRLKNLSDSLGNVDHENLSPLEGRGDVDREVVLEEDVTLRKVSG